jgi:formamidopyrimidine-DNA glycosylase
MPELPEVETVVRQLRTVLVGKSIQQVEVLKQKSWTGDPSQIIGVPIQEISRRSKMIRIHFKNELNIIIHLKMSGQLIYEEGGKRLGGGHPTADWIQKLPSSHTRVAITFSDGTHLYFNDQRIFGWLRVVTEDEVKEAVKGLAPDIIDDAITSEYVFARAKNRRIPIKQLIMDNQILSGVGNIYACDALNLAKISPLRPATTLSAAEVKILVAAMKEVVFLGIELGGATTDGKYVHLSGMGGKYQDVMRVYGKKDQPCLNCGVKIVKMKLAGRGTYYCPNCQK